MTLQDELPRSEGTQYATGEEWRNNSRKNEETEPKQTNKQTKKKHLVVDVTVMEVNSDALKNNVV